MEPSKKISLELFEARIVPQKYNMLTGLLYVITWCVLCVIHV